ncbi:MAG: protein kinase [Deltaproteobacteria bacterium]|nr:protein kinase [Deltaproteobacteria bacterium]
MSAPFRFGPFFLDSRIAVGGTAEVYLARPATPDSGLPEKLVVKRLLPHFAADPEGRTMFDREARLHAAVTHPNVVTVFHAGKDDRGEPYLAMEYIDGVDGYRLLRRLRQDDELLPVGVAIFVAREVLRALESVHAARDPLSGGALGIVHRDVSPSNIYLSKDGKVKLGDFGIARSTTRTTLRSEAGQVLKGKFAYLAPEQVAGELSDHRADLFSLGTVLAEILLNKPLFPGGGQLAILLAIRDCKIDALTDIRSRLPPGLFEILQKALSRNPGHRYQNATELLAALAPYEADPRLAVREIAARVRWVQSASSSDQMAAVRESVRAMKAVRGPRSGGSGSFAAQSPEPAAAAAPQPARPTPPARPAQPAPTTQAASAPRAAPSSDIPEAMAGGDHPERKTEEYELMPSRVIKESGERLGPWTFARLMEALATGQIARGDRVDFVGRGFKPVEEIEEFQRFLPNQTAQTGKVAGPGSPDFQEQLGVVSMLDTLMRVLRQRETGVLFAERAGESTSDNARKELYFVAGKLHHVASSNASELLGEYLVRRGKLEREELDLALAVLPRYSGRMGDTLISMGLVGPVDIFRAIRDQGRDRVADLFLWKSGTVTFYRGQTAPHVEFPLDLELPGLMLAGLEAARPGDSPLEDRRHDLERTIGPVTGGDEMFTLDGWVTWPPLVTRVQALVKSDTTLRDVLRAAARSGSLSAGDTLRGLSVLVAAGLLGWKT